MKPIALVIATTNPGKTAELQRLLQSFPGIELRNLLDFDITKEVTEDGLTFEANALKKAREYALQTGCLTLADDSGLEVDVLHGAPGVFSARFAGPGATDSQNLELLLRKLVGVPEAARWARFRCALALVDPTSPEGHMEHVEEASVEGHIALMPKGTGGFGYDPIFIAKDYTKTNAELSPEEKDKVSHRARALAQMLGFLRQYIGLSGRP